MGYFAEKKPKQGWCVEWCVASRSYFWTSCNSKSKATIRASYILNKTLKNTILLGRGKWNFCFRVEESVLLSVMSNLSPSMLGEFGPSTCYLVVKSMYTVFTLEMPTNSVQKSIQKMSGNKTLYLSRKSNFLKVFSAANQRKRKNC